MAKAAWEHRISKISLPSSVWPTTGPPDEPGPADGGRSGDIAAGLVEGVQVPQEGVHIWMPGDLTPREVLVDFPLTALPVLASEPRLDRRDGDQGA